MKTVQLHMDNNIRRLRKELAQDILKQRQRVAGDDYGRDAGNQPLIGSPDCGLPFLCSYVDIDDHFGAATGCGSHPTDNFDGRVVSGTWGTSSTGLLWGHNSPGGGSVGVSGGAGFVTVHPTLQSAHVCSIPLVSCQGIGIPLRVKVLFSVDKSSSEITGTNQQAGIVGIRTDSTNTPANELYAELQFRTNAGGTPRVLLVIQNGGGGSQNTPESFPLTISAGVHHEMEAEWTSTACKIYIDGALQLDTTATIGGVPGGFPTPAQIELLFSNNQNATLDQTVSIYEFDIITATGPVVPAVLVSSPTSGALVVNAEMDAEGGNQYSTPTAAKAISSVWLDGIKLTEGEHYTVSASDPGLISMLSTIDSDSEVTANYYAM